MENQNIKNIRRLEHQNDWGIRMSKWVSKVTTFSVSDAHDCAGQLMGEIAMADGEFTFYGLKNIS